MRFAADLSEERQVTSSARKLLLEYLITVYSQPLLFPPPPPGYSTKVYCSKYQSWGGRNPWCYLESVSDVRNNMGHSGKLLLHKGLRLKEWFLWKQSAALCSKPQTPLLEQILTQNLLQWNIMQRIIVLSPSGYHLFEHLRSYDLVVFSVLRQSSPIIWIKNNLWSKFMPCLPSIQFLQWRNDHRSIIIPRSDFLLELWHKSKQGINKMML